MTLEAQQSRRLVHRLFDPVDISSLVVLRVVFGGLMLWEAYRFLFAGVMESWWYEPEFLFPYEGFEWVKLLPYNQMRLLLYAMGVAAIFMMIGFLYRFSAFFWFLGFTYTFLLEQAEYLNHFYFVILLSFLMICIPAHRAYSVDALLRPKIRSDTAPAWALWLMRGQVFVVYFFGAIAKMKADWFAGEPMRIWLSNRTHFPFIGQYFTEEWCVYLMSYSGILIDLLCPVLLLWRPTRLPALFALTLFHFTNTRLFNIGVFPWLGISTATLFFPPDWPRRFFREATDGSGWGSKLIPVGALFGAYAALKFKNDVTLVPMSVGAMAGAIFVWLALDLRRGVFAREPFALAAASGPFARHQRFVAAFFFIWFFFQTTLPLRHHLIPGDVNWTTEGHRFSWRMKLNDHGGSNVKFFAYDPETGDKTEINIQTILRRRQYRFMRSRPIMMQFFARYLQKEMEALGHGKKEIRVESYAGLNGREPQLFIDPTIDLASQPLFDWGRDWIYPLTTPLPSRTKKSEEALEDWESE